MKGQGQWGARARLGGLALVAMLLAVLAVAPAGAGAPQQGTVVARGLANPRGLAVTDDGTLYIAETGTGGAEQLPPAPEGPPGESSPTRGSSGRVTRVAPGGTTSVLADNLPSFGESGPNGLLAAGGALWLIVGGAGFGYLSLPAYQPLPNESAIVRIDPQTGAVAKVADLAAHERATNPDGGILDSNPWALALGADGNLYATDAGGNDVLRINPTTGRISTAAVLPGQPGPGPNPARGGRSEVDPVPTGIATGADGSLYVSTLPGGPPIPGGSKVIHIAPDGTQSDAVRGLFYSTYLTVGPDGLLYITQLFGGVDTSKQPPQPTPGRVVRARADGSIEVVAENLPAPIGTAFDRAGNLYVAINGAVLGPPPPSPQGQVVRYDRVAPPVAMPGLPNTGAGGVPPAPLAGLGLALAFGGLLLARRTRRGTVVTPRG